jgi:hypothetical protein
MAQPFLYSADTIGQKLWRRLLLLSGLGSLPGGGGGGSTPAGTFFGSAYFGAPMFGPRYFGTTAHSLAPSGSLGSYFARAFFGARFFGPRYDG